MIEVKIPYMYPTWCDVVVVSQCPQWQDQPKILDKKIKHAISY